MNSPKPARAQLMRDYALLIVIVALAAYLRLGFPSLTEFKADEARLYLLALDMAEFQAFPLRGIGSSVGLPNFPMSVWLYAIPLFIWKHPYAATLYVGLLNTIAVAMCFFFVRPRWGNRAAHFASLLFAVSPWAVIYSRKIWAQNLLPLFVLLYVWSAARAFGAQTADGDGKPQPANHRPAWALAVHVLLLATIVQIHLSGLAFIALTAIWLLLYRNKVQWRGLLAGVLLAALMFVPFGIYLWTQMGGGGSVAGVLGRGVSFSVESVRFAGLLLTGADVHALAGAQMYQTFLSRVPDMTWAYWVLIAASLAGGGLMIKNRAADALLLLSWWVAPMIFFAWHVTPVFPHYFITTLPAGFILAGYAFSQLRQVTERIARWQWRAVGAVGALLLIVIAGAQVWVGQSLLFFVGSVATPSGFGTPLGMLLEAARQVELENGAEVLVVSDGDDPAVHDFPAVAEVLLRHVPHRFVNGNEAAVLPSAGGAVWLANGELKARQWYDTWGESTGSVPLRAGEGAYDVLTMAPGQIVEPPNHFTEPRTLANGVQLLGWDAANGWAIFWRPGYIPAAARYHFFNHAADGQADGAGYRSDYWRDGDWIVSFFELPLSGDSVRVGMYEYPSITNVPVIDSAGNAFADAVVATIR